jgi:hypothetical protein
MTIASPVSITCMSRSAVLRRQQARLTEPRTAAMSFFRALRVVAPSGPVRRSRFDPASSRACALTGRAILFGGIGAVLISWWMWRLLCAALVLGSPVRPRPAVAQTEPVPTENHPRSSFVKTRQPRR